MPKPRISPTWCLLGVRSGRRANALGDARLARAPLSNHLVEEPVGEGFSRVEVAAPAHLLGDLLRRAAAPPADQGIEPPQQLLLLPAPRRELGRRPREACRRLGEMEARVRPGQAPVGGG